jgi:hypothetical protein
MHSTSCALVFRWALHNNRRHPHMSGVRAQCEIVGLASGPQVLINFGFQRSISAAPALLAAFRHAPRPTACLCRRCAGVVHNAIVAGVRPADALGRRRAEPPAADLDDDRRIVEMITAQTVMALTGWKAERMIRRYAAVTDHTLRAAAEAVSGAEIGDLGRLGTGPKPH